MENGNVDLDNVYVVGFCGGGYAALGYRFRTDIALKHTYSWAAVTDLNDWHITENLLIDIVSKSASKSVATLANRAVYLTRQSALVSLTVFDGSHEILHEAAFAEIPGAYSAER